MTDRFVRRHPTRPHRLRVLALTDSISTAGGAEKLAAEVILRLDPARFIRLGRGTLANLALITKISVMPGGTHVAILSNGQNLQVSRLQSRILPDRLLKI